MELIVGRIYKQTTDNFCGYEDWEYTGRTLKTPQGDTWYAFKNDRGCYYFDEEDLKNFILKEM